MKRVIVLGGLGHFGRTIIEQLYSRNIATLSASRRGGADLWIDAEDRDSIRATCRLGDLVIDAAGPFQERTTTLIESGAEIGFDVIDINDDLNYAQRVIALRERISDAGVRVLSSASSVSAIAATTVAVSQVNNPIRVSAFLAPASRHTANFGAARSLVRSVGQTVRVFHEGGLRTRNGWSEPRRFEMPEPLGQIRGRLFESADAVYLPMIWPSLRSVAMYVDTNMPGVNALLTLAAASPAIRRGMESQLRIGGWYARRFGSSLGGIGYEIERRDGRITRYAIVAKENSFIVAVAPAVLGAVAIMSDKLADSGLVLPNRHIAPGELLDFLGREGIEFREVL